MNWKLITQIVMGVGLGAWIVWDIVVASNRVPGDTISEITLGIAKSTPLLAVAVGVVAGHLFTSFESWGAVVSFVQARPLIPFIWGTVTGMLFWYQGR
jgi:hypothetical protein